MALSFGNRLGPYEILAAIGVGGMGEVYRARDAKLGRDVALKVLPEAFARDAERMARFQREAKVLASLDHPNIASIYGLEDSGGTHALVMALVEGPTLADRIRTGPIPLSEALPIAKQICDALEYAHERGIVHRDLKPANVKVTSDDAVKVLDFGLAKAIESDAASIDIATSPTISRMATLAGVLLGTAAYMSPEQTKGKSVDRRADIWAFGCVLYEMLTGKMAFSGETVTDTLASVIKDEPDWSQLPPATPSRARVLLQRCLQKDPKQRLRDIGDARISLGEILSGAPEQWSAAGERHPRLADLMCFQIPVPEGVTLSASAQFALSPDGRQLAFAATGSDGALRLWIRPLDSLEARPLPGSESPNIPPFFWSPNSRYIAFEAGGKLKKISISGGGAETLCTLSSGAAVGGAWNRDGVIIFGNFYGGLMQVSANGGSASPVTVVDASRGETRHLHPTFLPDGRHFIYLRVSRAPENSGIYVGSLDAKPEEQDSKRLLATQHWATYVPSSDPATGQLLLTRNGALVTQKFDPRRLEFVGKPITVAEQVGHFLNTGFFSVSANEVLAYRTGEGDRESQLTWFDPRGKRIGAVGEPGNYLTPALAPDGTRAIISRYDSSGRNPGGVWLLDLARGTSTRFTFGPSLALYGIWSPDGSRVAFSYNFGAVSDLYLKSASGVADEELLLKSDENKYPMSWSPDGRFLLYQASDPKTTKHGLWLLPFEGDKKPFPILRTDFNNRHGKLSPDARWIAYTSDESGRDEVYVQTFSLDAAGLAFLSGGKWLISTGGGSEPRWRGDGKVLYYLAADRKLMAVEIATDPMFLAGAPKVLFQAPPNSSTTAYSWDLTPDGKRFLFLALTEQVQAPFTVVLNWQEALKK